MVGIYFSGTGNSRYCVEKFLEEYEPQAEAFSIENENAALEIGRQDEIVLGYPVQFSSIPKILKDYVISNHEIWKGKRVFIIATMGLFSGDGAGIMARLLKRYGAVITGGLHVKMPDSIGDERALKRPLEKNNKEGRCRFKMRGTAPGRPWGSLASGRIVWAEAVFLL